MKHSRAFRDNNNHSVTYAEVLDFRENFQAAFPGENHVSYYFDGEKIDTILDQKGVVGIRYYYAIDNVMQHRLVVSGVDLQGKDLVETIPPAVSGVAIPKDSDENCNFGKMNHHIQPGEAAQWTSNYRSQKAKNQPKGGFFSKNAVKNVIHQKDAAGLVWLPGADQRGIRVMCIGGIDKKGEIQTFGNWIELAMPCPPWCDVVNYLNSDVFKTTLS